ncbi:MAG: DUF177 domain-containing protein, partial [Alphaproteobacteria bacterium]|nr:DUF177 domain-containing protein [Alphaproteobacteria bacterium]
KIDELNQNQYKYVLHADQDELEDITKILQVEDVRRFHAEIYLKNNRKENLLKVWGTVEARIELQSVISLEKFFRNMKVPFELIFDTAATYQDIRDMDTGIDEDVPDIVINGTINLADICIEQIALNLDDYPRSEGEEFDYAKYDKIQSEKKENPFAILKKLKK